MSSRLNLPRAHLSQALTQRIMFAGGERTPVLLVGMISIYIAFVLSARFAWWTGIVAGGALWFSGMWILRRMGRADPYMLQVFNRHIKYKSFYPARGRVNAFNKNIKDFK